MSMILTSEVQFARKPILQMKLEMLTKLSSPTNKRYPGIDRAKIIKLQIYDFLNPYDMTFSDL